MDQPRRHDRAERGAEVEANPGHLRRSQSAVALDLAFQGVPMEELHPHPDSPRVRADPVHVHHTAMTDARQGTGLLEKRRVAGSALAHGEQKLERHLPLKPRVPSPPDFATLAGAGELEKGEVSPLHRCRDGRAVDLLALRRFL
jgi:hypothetical protein